MVKTIVFKIAPKYYDRARSEKENLNSILSNIISNYNFDLATTKHGYGQTIKGNEARDFLSNPIKFSETTHINVEIIEKFAKIASCLLSTRKINVNLYKELCQKTCNKWTEVFPNESLTPTLHKILLHSYEIIEFYQRKYECGIGFFSEECSEALNHLLKESRKRSRQNSRLNLNTDTMRNLYLQTSNLNVPLGKNKHIADIEYLFEN